MVKKLYDKNNKKLITGWAMYDWANSVYSLTITTAVFPIYYLNVTTHGTNDHIKFLGLDIENSVLYAYALSFSFLFIGIISPLLSSIADFKGNKLNFMKFFCYSGSIACLALYFFTGDNIYWGIFPSVIASIGFCGSIVFYNS